ncbi:hypothetical protein ABZX51_005679 [Aspergillus tubingensis]
MPEQLDNWRPQIRACHALNFHPVVKPISAGDSSSASAVTSVEEVCHYQIHLDFVQLQHLSSLADLHKRDSIQVFLLTDSLTASDTRHTHTVIGLQGSKRSDDGPSRLDFSQPLLRTVFMVVRSSHSHHSLTLALTLPTFLQTLARDILPFFQQPSQEGALIASRVGSYRCSRQWLSNKEQLRQQRAPSMSTP